MVSSIEKKTQVLAGLFITALIAANLLGTKITTLWGISFSVGIFAYPVTFLITDIIEEVHGPERTKGVVLAGLLSLVFLFLLVILSTFLPPAARYPHNDAYLTVFSTSLRIIIASLVAFLFSQLHDLWSFAFWKRKTKGRFLWLRNNASTIVSQAIDTTLFMFIAFWHVPVSFLGSVNTPEKFTAGFIWTLIIPYYLLKVLFALADTPFVYLGVWWLRGKKKKMRR
ncbi:MAG: queuosine precursor transporter [DPANN group archaeon]|nr:queuosine precursor transporter [DPANN group archaeon]